MPAASSARVSNADLRVLMDGMLAEIKAIPRVDPERIGGIETRLVRIEEKQDGLNYELRSMCKRVEALEGQRREANGTHAQFDKRMALLEREDEGQKVNWGRVWTIVQAVILMVLTAIVSGLWKP